jgi:DNA-binding MarR family transcriptional regulator
VNIELTEEGLAVVTETVRRRDAWLESVLAELEPDERELLAAASALMRKVADL